MSGEVCCFVDLESLLDRQSRSRLGVEEVLNGIAYDEDSDRLFVTGKCWPSLFQIRVAFEERPEADGHQRVGFGDGRNG